MDKIEPEEEAPDEIEDKRPREDMGVEEMVVSVLREREAPCSVKEVAAELAEKEWLYAVIAGQKATVSKVGLEKIMKESMRVRRVGNDEWVVSY